MIAEQEQEQVVTAHREPLRSLLGFLLAGCPNCAVEEVLIPGPTVTRHTNRKMIALGLQLPQLQSLQEFALLHARFRQALLHLLR